jgi:hypothetical protein
MSRRSAGRPVAVHELLGTETAAEKLGARGISVEEAQQLPRNNHRTIPNRGRSRHGSQRLRARRLLVGHTDGGRTLMLVIEQTNDPTTWLIITVGPRQTISVESSRTEL